MAAAGSAVQFRDARHGRWCPRLRAWRPIAYSTVISAATARMVRMARFRSRYALGVLEWLKTKPAAVVAGPKSGSCKGGGRGRARVEHAEGPAPSSGRRLRRTCTSAVAGSRSAVAKAPLPWMGEGLTREARLVRRARRRCARGRRARRGRRCPRP